MSSENRHQQIDEARQRDPQSRSQADSLSGERTAQTPGAPAKDEGKNTPEGIRTLYG